MEKLIQLEKANPDLTGFALWLLKQGRSEKTVRVYMSFLKNLSRLVDLRDPEAVKEAIYKMNVELKTKTIIVSAYSTFLKFIGKTWEKPKYRAEEKIPFIPTEEELDQLIAGCGKKTSTFLQLLKETGARFKEVAKLRWIDVDLERRVVSITPEKRSKPRILPISSKLVGMLQNLPKKEEKIFSAKSITNTFFKQRRRLARKLNNPRILRVSFHTFRHWKATMEYHKTKDIIHVKELLGHRNIQNTMIYISIENALFQTSNEEFYCKTASTIEEASKLIESGFDYVTTFNGIMLFRKRK